MILTSAQLAAARLRADALSERTRANLPDSLGPVDLPGGCWKLGFEDDSVLIVACGIGWAGQMRIREDAAPSACTQPCSVCGPEGCNPQCSVCAAEQADTSAGLGPRHPEDPR
jgi:hypothetical protein